MNTQTIGAFAAGAILATAITLSVASPAEISPSEAAGTVATAWSEVSSHAIAVESSAGMVTTFQAGTQLAVDVHIERGSGSTARITYAPEDYRVTGVEYENGQRVLVDAEDGDWRAEVAEGGYIRVLIEKIREGAASLEMLLTSEAGGTGRYTLWAARGAR